MTDEQLVEYAKSTYGDEFAEAVRQALASESLRFAERVRRSLIREMERQQ